MKKDSAKLTIRTLAGILAVLFFIAAGCKSSQKKEGDSQDTEDVKSTKEAVIEELAGYPIPTSFEITEFIYQAGAPYILSLSNEPEKAGNYITQRDKSLNLGIYGTDLCYASTYMMKQATMLYLESSKTLIDELGISTQFNSDYATRVENNLDNRDSLISIVTESFSDTWEYLVGNKQDVLARLVVCGSWIEGIYITSSIALTSKDPSEILEILARQKNSLDKLVALLEPVKDVEDVTLVFKGLFDLQDIYKNVGEALTDEQLEKVSTLIDELRSALV
jgi:hypothetical protein